MRKTLLTVLGLCLSVSVAFAQGVPFRKHRYDGFKTHKVDTESIVFFGNSITNMHEWWEAFGNSKILNRGVNGAETPIMLEHFETILAGHPAKVYLMMGTNDLGTSGMNTPAFVANNVRTAVKRLKKESPTTKVYVQSILPCTTNASGLKDITHVPIANDSLKKICEEFDNATYIDLYSDLKGIESKTISYDGTHLTMAGYRIWCNKIAEYVGSSCVYPTDATDQNGGLSGIAGMRNTYFAGYPITADDILILGDDGNDWHELLNSAHVKQRGGSWGYQSIDLGTMKSMLKNIFKGRADNVAPKTVCVTLGYKEAAAKTDSATFMTSYKAVVDSIHALASTSKVKLFAIYPSNTADINTSYTTKYNAGIKALAETLDYAEYVETSYTSLVKDGVINSDYFTNGYMTGKGYAKLSQAFATAIGEGVTATTDEEAAARIATFNARTALYTAIGTAEGLSIGTGTGQYTAENAASLLTGIEEGYTLLAKTDVTDDELTTKATTYQTSINEVLPKINQPTASTDGDEHWYQLYTPNRGSKYMTSQGAGNQLTGGTNTKYAKTMWKFVKRTDGSFDIVNRGDNSYVSPSASYDSAISTTKAQPSSGWTLSYASASGLYIISSGTVQLNQTNDAAIYNWSDGQTGTDRTDTGCQFAIVDAPEVEAEPEPVNFKGSMVLSLNTGAYANPSNTYNKLWTSTATAPQVTFSCAANNMAKSDTCIVLYSGQSQTSDYIINAGSGYVVTGYKFKFVNQTSGSAAKTITANGTAYTTSDTVQELEVTGLSGQTASFNLKGANNGVVLTEFIVTIQSSDYEEEIDGMNVAMTTGTYSGSGSFHAKWTSTATDPQLTLSCAYNNMASNGDNLTLYVGSTSSSCTYTLSAPSGYIITGYQFNFANCSGNSSTLTLVAGDNTYSSSSASQHVEVTGLTKQQAKFTLSGENKGIELSKFYVTVEKADIPVEPQKNIFIYDTSRDSFKIVYRIPAIAQAKNGNLVAVADYRYSGGDIGSGRLDLRYACSVDSGKTWTEPQTLVSCDDYTDTSVLMNTGFGDPCIVADRESDRVLLLSCSGNVMFPNGTHDKHQAIARFYSEDGGKTWGKPTDISESIYSQFDTCKIGTAKSMFVGSGRIFQSSTVKVGTAYRLYCSVLFKDVNNVNKNYVLYSDNFGDTWSVLGGVNVAPIPSGGDEPKAEELPDGSILCSSRVTGGRYYNIFHFSNSDKAEGTWGSMAFSGASNNGVTAEGNSCNGEVMVIPAQRKKDNKDVYLILQSLPLGSGRANVGIYYKELASLADFVNADSLAKNWDGVHQASYLNSAYSTMALQADNTIGFLYEESTFGTGLDYTIVYKNYSIETITDSAYTFKAGVDPMAITKENSDVIVTAVTNNTGNIVGNYDASGASDVTDAYSTFKDNATKANYEAVNAAVSKAPVVELGSAVKYRLYSTARGGMKYLSASASGLSVGDLDENDSTQLFSFIPDAETGNWKILNEKSNVYIGSTPAVYGSVPVKESADDAALYRISSKVNGESALICQSPTNASFPAIHLDGSCKLVPWTTDAGASQWYIVPTNIATDIETAAAAVLPQTKVDVIYDLQGRRVSKATKGVFIINGRKEIR